ncbi:MAG: glycosyltransferase family 4 protein [Candidatus Poseidoniaceae archaeon]|nr:glycosyltransferase family 4 protein [Candidatus Poseidoniaceae archaeon]
MRRVLHVGPIDAQGGISSVMRILSTNPPEGWRASTLSSHSSGSIFSKLLAWKKARKEVRNSKADLIHIHSAADWSFRRKLSIAKISKVPVIFHIHSGNFRIKCEKNLQPYHVVTLSEEWRVHLQAFVGDSTAIVNPIDPLIEYNNEERDDFVLLMGRSDPVKGHDFAYSLGIKNLKVTGVYKAPGNIEALGWVTEVEKIELLKKAKTLIVPSKFEGQPMVILEALAAGCPVIASDSISGLPECVASVSLKDKEEWLRAIENPITGDYTEHVSEHRIENVNHKWKQFYDSIVDSNVSTE